MPIYDRTLQHRPVTIARHGVVAAPHYLAAQAGLDLLKAGGNAVDAAIAANATLQVVYPFVCGIGGDMFAIVADSRTGTIAGLNGSGRSAQAATIERYQSLGMTTMPTYGVHTVTVPGCVHGWQTLADRFGRLGLAEALQPAIRYAREGFPVGPDLHRALTRMQTLAHAHPSWHAHFLPTGTIPPVGSLASAPNLAATLEIIARAGADAFYRGPLAEQIAAFFAREGGLITTDDLAAHTSEWVQPLHVPFGDIDIYELPPNTQGVTALQMLGILDPLTLGAAPLDPQTIHLAVSAKQLAFVDRSRYLTDPRHMTIDPATLIDPAYLAAKSAQIDPRLPLGLQDQTGTTGDTISLCAADGDGLVVSFIQSNYMGFGSGLVVEGTGIVLQNRGAYFTLDPASANALGPGKRTLHTLIPSMGVRAGKPVVAFGSMGGDGQAQTHLQVYTALQKYDYSIQAAIEMPRWVHSSISKGATLAMEARFPAETFTDLAQRGYHIERAEAWDALMGYAQGIVIDQESGMLFGGSDPRAEGIAAGW